MARKPPEAAADVAEHEPAPPAMVAVTIVAEGVKVDSAGNLPVGIRVMVSAAEAERLKEAGEAE